MATLAFEPPSSVSTTYLMKVHSTSSSSQQAPNYRRKLPSTTPKAPRQCPSARDFTPSAHHHPQRHTGPTTPSPSNTGVRTSHHSTPSVNTGPRQPPARHSPSPSQYTCTGPARRPSPNPAPHAATGTPATFDPFPAPPASPPHTQRPACGAGAVSPPRHRPGSTHRGSLRGRARRSPAPATSLGLASSPLPRLSSPVRLSRLSHRETVSVRPPARFSAPTARGGGRACAASARSPGTRTERALLAAPPCQPPLRTAGAQALPLGNTHAQAWPGLSALYPSTPASARTSADTTRSPAPHGRP
ncbi:uncharacterized protein LOC127382890 [Apus apus]|uniref:uncharacterized protein LOC127382890 n=1 Tax=Apus apus TaxID=8895 RepID=UPI0021F89961|nr:uncharacterized protein LOC127382890 [Apus apus]